MRRTSTEKKTDRKTSRAIYLAASALAVTASLAGTSAIADHKGYNYDHHDRGHKQHSYRYGPIYRHHQQKVRVRIPVRDHGPETLPLGRLIMQNSDVDLNRYRLVAVVTRNGRFSNGFASLRTGNSKTQRYFLGSHESTWIPAPSRADRTWHLRLGPGTQVRSVTAVLEPRRHGWAHRTPANRHHAAAGPYNQGTLRQGNHGNHRATQSTPLPGLAWLIANADDGDWERKQAKRLKKLRAEQARTRAQLAETQRKLDLTRERNKRLKDQRARLAEERAHERVETGTGKRGKTDEHRRGSRKGERVTEREIKRTVRYVTSTS